MQEHNSLTCVWFHIPPAADDLQLRLVSNIINLIDVQYHQSGLVST